MIPLEKIHKEVVNYFHIQENQIFKKTRVRHIVDARQIFHYLSRKHNGKRMSLQTIAEYGSFTNSHSTVLNSIKTVNNLMQTEKQFKANVLKIEEILTKKIQDVK